MLLWREDAGAANRDYIMTIKSHIYLFLFVLSLQQCCLLACPVIAQNIDEPHQLAKKPSWTNRAVSFSQLKLQLRQNDPNSASDKAAVAGLISLLNIEADYVASGTPLDENYSEYFANLIQVVASLKSSNAITALLKPSVIVTGDMAIVAVARFGDAALAQVIQRDGVVTSDVEKSAITSVMSTMLIEKTLSTAENRAKVERSLLRAAADPDPYVRIAAIRGLSSSGDSAAMQVLKKLKDSDPFFVSNQQGKSYIVRNEAARLIRQ